MKSRMTAVDDLQVRIATIPSLTDRPPARCRHAPSTRLHTARGVVPSQEIPFEKHATPSPPRSRLPAVPPYRHTPTRAEPRHPTRSNPSGLPRAQRSDGQGRRGRPRRWTVQALEGEQRQSMRRSVDVRVAGGARLTRPLPPARPVVPPRRVRSPRGSQGARARGCEEPTGVLDGARGHPAGGCPRQAVHRVEAQELEGPRGAPAHVRASLHVHQPHRRG